MLKNRLIFFFIGLILGIGFSLIFFYQIKKNNDTDSVVAEQNVDSGYGSIYDGAYLPDFVHPIQIMNTDIGVTTTDYLVVSKHPYSGMLPTPTPTWSGILKKVEGKWESYVFIDEQDGRILRPASFTILKNGLPELSLFEWYGAGSGEGYLITVSPENLTPSSWWSVTVCKYVAGNESLNFVKKDGIFVAPGSEKYGFMAAISNCNASVVFSKESDAIISNPRQEEKNYGEEFLHDELLHTEYHYVWSWPPDIKITDSAFFCPEISEDLRVKQTKKTINGRLYCVKEESDGAAGHVFVDYRYSTVKENKLVDVGFVIRYTDCGNYGEPAMQNKCEKDQQSYDPDGLADKIINYVKVESEIGK